MGNNKERALALIKGGYDLHTHSMPSHFPRSLNDFDLLREADRYGMAGIMLKSHYDQTASRAYLVNQKGRTAAKAFGGIALNRPQGGVNPDAAEACLRLGGRMVWMPTFDSLQFRNAGALPGAMEIAAPLTIFDDGGALIPAVFEIFEVVKKYDVYLATGHLSEKESIALCTAGVKEKVKLILTHPDFQKTPVSFATQTALADKGVLIEKAWLNVHWGHISAEAFAESIKRLGSHRVFFVTDAGQADNKYPPESFIEGVISLLDYGLGDADIVNVVRKVPQSIVGA
jgi:hypothetical protein